MKKRVELLTRIGKLASQMHALGKWRLSAIERQQASLSKDLRAVFEALERGDLGYGARAALSGPRIHSLQKKLDALASESERVRRAAHGHGIRTKLAERAAETADKLYREHEARKELAELVERTLLRRDASQG